MKNLLKYGFIAFVICFLWSCDSIKREPIENYKGCIIYDNTEKYRDYKTFIIKTDTSFKQIHVYDLDFQKYNVGDTVK